MKTKMRTFLEEEIKETEKEWKIAIEEMEKMEEKKGKYNLPNEWRMVIYLQGKIYGLKKALDLSTLIK